ncbi:MAG: hypothetical protein HYX76_03325 [Acidobacteria bacterium]|nr:hypothetical protein [Acidobacteriota bacterium]
MVKTVGRRRVEGGGTGVLQHTLAAVRATGAVVPRGVYRFSSFEEADAWMMRTMARTHASLKSKQAVEGCAPKRRSREGGPHRIANPGILAALRAAVRLYGRAGKMLPEIRHGLTGCRPNR